MRLIEEDEGINELNGETDTTPAESRSEMNSTYRKETLRKDDTVIPTTKRFLWENAGKPMLIGCITGGITGVLLTELIECLRCLLYLLRAV